MSPIDARKESLTHEAPTEIDHPVVRPDSGDALPSARDAQEVLLHCIKHELAARGDYALAPPHGADRVDAAYAVVVQRSARLAAEALAVEAARLEVADAEPVIVRYRLIGQPDWSGRCAGADPQTVIAEVRKVLDVATRYGAALQATSVSQGWTAVSAARIPDLAFATACADLRLDAPRLGI